jgi:hypothetical protein
MSIPNKGDIIINPQTQRPVKVGSRTWLKLVKQGIVAGQYKDPKVLSDDPSYELEDDGSNIEEMKLKINKKLPKGKHAVKGRGRHKGKIVVRNKRLNPKDVAKYTTKASASAMANNMSELENLSDEDLEKKLEELILKEMMREQRPQSAPSSGRGRKKKVQEEQYELDEESDDTQIDMSGFMDDAEIDDFDDGEFDPSLEW